MAGMMQLHLPTSGCCNPSHPHWCLAHCALALSSVTALLACLCLVSTALPALSHVFVGTLIDAPEWGAGVRIRPQRVLGVSASSGAIAFVGGAEEAAFGEEQLRLRYALPSEGLTVLRPTQFLLPGFIDTHCHAPQFQFAGAGTDRDLMVWLRTYTFPAEARLADVELARQVYARLVHAALANGTTTAFYYVRRHLHTSAGMSAHC